MEQTTHTAIMMIAITAVVAMNTKVELKEWAV